MKKTLAISALLFGATAFYAQSSKTIWTAIEESSISVKGKRDIIPDKYRTYHLDMPVLQTILNQAPSDRNTLIKHSTSIVSLPLPNGSVQQFYLLESPVMAPALQTSYPNIRTYSVHGIDDPYASGKLDLTEYGFHGMIRSPYGDVYIDPYCKNNISDYISYYVADFQKPEMYKLPEIGLIKDEEDHGSVKRVAAPTAVCAGTNLRTYRLAIGCTGEYAIAATGNANPTVAQTLAKVVTTVNRVDGVYETEVAVRLVLVPTTTLTLYTTPGTGYTTAENSSAFSLISKSQSLITAQIGSANFDIGHTFSTGGGGLASLGCVCSSSVKARGITGSPNPVGDPYDIDYVAHEMGHQFSGNHTFNANSGAGSCAGNRNATTSVEPGSGVTIMGYAGICGSTNDLAGHSIPYFHAVSYDEITNFINAGGNSCASSSATGNTPPSVTAASGYVIPVNTPFTLTGSATDPDGDALTYQWEETDPGTGSGGNWNTGAKPYFMSYAPGPNPSRMFPKLSVILSGNLQGTKGEYMPTTAQTLKFRLTARDNKMGGGGVCAANVSVTVNASGPFSVTSQSVTGISYFSGSTQAVTWDVNGTNAAPVNCTNVNIYVSNDAGNTFTLVAANTANDGTENVTLPVLAVTSTICRVKVESVGNIFFDINSKPFTIYNTLTGINQYASGGIQINLYPNPFSNSIRIDIAGITTSGTDHTTLKVYDILGHLVKTEKLKLTENYSESFDLSDLASGSYMVEVSNGEQKSVTRVVKL